MNDDRSKNNLSKLSIYTKQFVVSSIYLINRAHKKQVLSVYSSHYVSIYFWIWWLQTMKSFSKLYTIFYTMLKTKVSHLSLKCYTWTEDPFLAFHSGNWFMADSPLSCLFIKSLVLYLKCDSLFILYISHLLEAIDSFNQSMEEQIK